MINKNKQENNNNMQNMNNIYAIGYKAVPNRSALPCVTGCVIV